MRRSKASSMANTPVQRPPSSPLTRWGAVAEVRSAGMALVDRRQGPLTVDGADEQARRIGCLCDGPMLIATVVRRRFAFLKRNVGQSLNTCVDARHIKVNRAA